MNFYGTYGNSTTTTVAVCWCTSSDSWSSLGTAAHLPDGTCPIRAHWLEIEDSE